VAFTCIDNRWTWPGAARCLPSLAPNLAPRDLLSTANLRPPGSAFSLKPEKDRNCEAPADRSPGRCGRPSPITCVADWMRTGQFPHGAPGSAVADVDHPHGGQELILAIKNAGVSGCRLVQLRRTVPDRPVLAQK
jgi:hypothetical protein